MAHEVVGLLSMKMAIRLLSNKMAINITRGEQNYILQDCVAPRETETPVKSCAFDVSNIWELIEPAGNVNVSDDDDD